MSYDGMKYCPMISRPKENGDYIDGLWHCREQACAWWVGDRCAVAVIAHAADMIAVAVDERAGRELRQKQ